MAFTGMDRLTRLWGPMAEAVMPREAIDREKRIERALGADGYVRTDALPPDAVMPHVVWWTDETGIATATLMPTHYIPVPSVLRMVTARCATPPTGQSVNLHIETPDDEMVAMLSIPAGEEYAETRVSVPLEGGTWLRAQITQVGSGTAGSNLTIHAVLYPRSLTGDS